jgi:GTP-binding protein HflX
MEIKESLSELDQLVQALGAEVVGGVVQRLPQWNPSSLIGSGKIEEIQKLVEDTKADFVVIDHGLTGAQGRNLAEELKVPVLDRTQLILEIFALRAQSHEGKLQVELAQNLDQFSRMVGAWHGSLSRLGGGIGTRGPGEKAIEVDRRTIRKRISKIRKELEETRAHRALHRASRRRNNIPAFALIGYTNTGKSTLLSELTNTQVLVADQFFATLDPTTRKVYLPDAPQAVLTDTVGFIRKLPTQLVEAFKATLEETDDADVIIHVVDLSSHEWQKQMATVEQMIDDFGWRGKPILYVFNKCDLAPQERKFRVQVSPRIFCAAAKREGLDELKKEMTKLLNGLTQEYELFFPHAERHRVFELSREGQILRQEEASTGVVCVVRLTLQSKGKWKSFLVSPEQDLELASDSDQVGI